MANLKKLLAYKELCGVNNKELVTFGGYKKTEQYVGQCLRGIYPVSDATEKEIYSAINIARANKLMKTLENIK